MIRLGMYVYDTSWNVYDTSCMVYDTSCNVYDMFWNVFDTSQGLVVTYALWIYGTSRYVSVVVLLLALLIYFITNLEFSIKRNSRCFMKI